MSSTLQGNQLYAILESEESEVSVDETNNARAKVTYTGRWPDAATLALSVNVHPEFTALIRKGFSVQRVSPKLAKVVIEFEGVVNEEGDEEPAIYTRYTLNGTTSSEPIETHPKFPDFGGEPETQGTKDTNSKGAMFDELGRFLGFAIDTDDNGYYVDANRNKAGVKSYLGPGFVYSEEATYNRLAVETIALNMNNLGNIDTPPNSNILPSVKAPRDWILIGAEITDAGEGVVFKRSWRLSGKRGWDKDIYTD